MGRVFLKTTDKVFDTVAMCNFEFVIPRVSPPDKLLVAIGSG